MKQVLLTVSSLPVFSCQLDCLTGDWYWQLRTVTREELYAGFQERRGWSKAHALVLRTYRETLGMPKDEIFGVTCCCAALQLRLLHVLRKAVDFAVDLRRAAASCNEMEYLIVLARDLTFWKPELADSLIEDTVEVRKIIFGLLRKM